MGYEQWSRGLPRLRDPDSAAYSMRGRLSCADHEDPTQLALLLRQATDSMEWALVDYLGPLVTRRVGVPHARTLDDVYVLRWVGAGRPTSTTDVADLLGRKPATVSHRLRRLNEQGLIERGPNLRDCRISTISLTEAGRELLREIEDAIDEITGLWVEDVGEVPGLTMEMLGQVLARMARVA